MFASQAFYNSDFPPIRYELPLPPAAQKNDLNAWQESVDNSMAQLEHQATRYVVKIKMQAFNFLVLKCLCQYRNYCMGNSYMWGSFACSHANILWEHKSYLQCSNLPKLRIYFCLILMPLSFHAFCFATCRTEFATSSCCQLMAANRGGCTMISLCPCCKNNRRKYLISGTGSSYLITWKQTW